MEGAFVVHLEEKEFLAASLLIKTFVAFAEVPADLFAGASVVAFTKAAAVAFVEAAAVAFVRAVAIAFVEAAVVAFDEASVAASSAVKASLVAASYSYWVSASWVIPSLAVIISQRKSTVTSFAAKGRVASVASASYLDRGWSVTYCSSCLGY